MRWILVALVCVAAVVGVGYGLRGRIAFGHAPARAEGHLDDAAKLLGPFAGVVERQCIETSRDLGVDIRVATRRDGGEDVGPLAERLFRELGVGADAPTGGILVLLEAGRGQARIEVSYSLEGLLPDLIVSRLAGDQLGSYPSPRAARMA